MKKSSQNYLIDLLGFMCFVFLASTGVIMHYILPAGSGHDLGIWGLSRHDWGAIHFWISVAFFGVMALHLIWHWKWIVNMMSFKRREEFNWRAGLGAVGVIGILMISIGPLLVKPTFPEGMEITTEQTIRGSMNLQQVSETTGVPADYLIKKLGLPADVGLDQPLRLLKDEYGFDMGAVRMIVEEYRE